MRLLEIYERCKLVKRWGELTSESLQESFLNLDNSPFSETVSRSLLLVDKSGTSCYHLVTRLMRPTDSQEVVPTSLMSSARNKVLMEQLVVTR